MLSEKLQKQLDQAIAKKDQAAFIEQAVKEKLGRNHPAPSDKNMTTKKRGDLPSDSIELFTDGGSRGNPGIAGGGFVIFQKGNKVHEGCEFFGHKTNNQSEYLALRLGLREAFEKFGPTPIKCYMDSELIVKQMNGEYKVKNGNMKPLYEEVQRIVNQFKSVHFHHIDRSQNSLADQLANQAMNQLR